MSKQLISSFAKLLSFQFTADSTLLLVGLMDGEVHAYDSSGNFAVKIFRGKNDVVSCKGKDDHKDKIKNGIIFCP